MVVMEYIPAQAPARHLQAEECDQLNGIIKTLHDEGFMFGDLWLQNIVITEEGKVQLIDFDWAGKDGEAKYPLSISKSICWAWALGVKGGRLIRKDHDLFMLKELLWQFSSVSYLSTILLYVCEMLALSLGSIASVLCM